MVDGAANPYTVLTLSHWPGNNTPACYKRDLSAEIAFSVISDPAFVPPAKIVSNNHFDEDGLVSVFALILPERALEYKESLIDIARAGDFGVYQDLASARASFVLNAWANPAISPLNEGVFKKPYHEITAILYEELLQRLLSVIDKVEHLERYWREEDAFLQASLKAFDKGLIEIEEDQKRNLAIIRIDDAVLPRVNLDRATSWVSQVIHPMAIHNRTDAMRILVIKGRMQEFYYRYETWVDYVSRKLPPRLDLHQLASRLNELEKGRGRWKFNGVSEIIARLNLNGHNMSEIGEVRFIKELRESLDHDSI
ncbi:MAG: hypothetical protein IPP97_18225 [Candidatus Obscuribacter sp.]|nr:hypothetical protein [Candidatus Obscuribacter sp.]MBP6591946.1 hypothetical protein [Candidatus Obscuribacter sp.]MBP7578234.1 hypothetical protein [Candidatus Obscuribacter sp.]